MEQNNIDFAGWTLLECRGGNKAATSRDFLQGHLTCDVGVLRGGDGAGSGFSCLLGAACDLKGRAVATMFLLAAGGDNAGNSDDDNSILLFLPTDSVAPLRELWDKYLMLYRGVSLTLYEGDIAPMTIDSLLTWVDAAATNAAGGSATGDDWNAYLIDRGIAYVTATTSGLMTPQMLGYDKLGEELTNPAAGNSATVVKTPAAVSFTKGCYLGQEVVARVHYKGKSARLCYRVSFAATDLVGDGPCPIFCRVQDKENEVGYLVNHYTKDGSCHGIALLSSNKVDQSNLYIKDQPVELI